VTNQLDRQQYNTMATINNNNPTKTEKEDHHLNIKINNLANCSPVSSSVSSTTTTTNEEIGRNRDGHENKVFVGGLHSSTTTEKLSNYFYQFGSIVDVVVLMDPITKVCVKYIFNFIIYFV
jgi:RNA recognition motif-containing protein